MFAENEVKNIEEYNAKNKYIRHKIIVFDEIADYLFNDKILANLKTILERYRAVGVYLIIATQRPDILKEKDLLKLFSTTIILKNNDYDVHFDFLKNKEYFFDDKRDMVIKSPVFENKVLQMKTAEYFDSEELNILHNKSIREMTEDDYKKILQLPEDKFVSIEERELRVKKNHGDDEKQVEDKEVKLKDVQHILKDVANQAGIDFLKDAINGLDVISATVIQRYLRIGFGAAHKILKYLVQVEAIEDFDGTAKPRKILDKEKLIKLFN